MPTKSYAFLFIALEDSGLDLIVYAGDPSNPSQKYNLEANVSCPVAAFPADVENLVSGQAFGHPMACGGNAINGKLLYSTNTRFSLQIWPVENLVSGQAFRQSMACGVINAIDGKL